MHIGLLFADVFRRTPFITVKVFSVAYRKGAVGIVLNRKGADQADVSVVKHCLLGRDRKPPHRKFAIYCYWL